ncbi:homogentisate phytyltransferase 1, chloroplastic [Lactuca sativa]|uniref:homogentisate phytyltransferase 1, chloroplastic n=1 Tax=Lactuca sativa TaxID=4236 RepID=UPI0022AF718D|nr:homogentisate phytyltransferase 1, chloroplastic [Lactuca sativa]
MVEGESSKNPKKSNGKRKFKGKDHKSSKKKDKLVCWNCNKPGHFKKDCRLRKVNKDGAGPSGSKDPEKQQGQIFVSLQISKYIQNYIYVISEAFYVQATSNCFLRYNQYDSSLHRAERLSISHGLALFGKNMKSMPIGFALKPSSSSLRTPLVATAVGSVKVSKVQVWKTIRLRDSNVTFERSNHLHGYKLNDPESANKYCSEFHRHQRRTKLQANASSEFSINPHDSEVAPPQKDGKSLGATLDLIYRYSRAYTLKGTVLSIISISLLAVQNLSDFTPSFFLGVLQAIIGGCLANLYVVGINQLSDIDIDKVNKPYLPLASGDLSVKTGILLTSLYAILGFCLGWSTKSWPLKLGLLLWYAFGTAYSVNLPLLRWKSIPALAAMCLWSVQGAIIPILFHLHAQTNIYGRSLSLSQHAIFVFGFMSIYGIVIALFKDIPDVEGDKLNGINSVALQIGKKPVFWLCIWLLEMAYGVAILIGLSSTRFWIRSLMVIGHSILGFILWREANLVDLKSDVAIESFYLFIWKLYYMEYLMVPVLRF